jgi:hypothetical protein
VTGAGSTWSPPNTARNPSPHLREVRFYRLLFGFSFTLSFRQSEATRNPSFFYGNLNLPGAPPYACEKVLRVPGADSTCTRSRPGAGFTARSIERRIPHCICARLGFCLLLFGFSFTLSFRQSEATRNPSFFYGNLNLPGAPPYACEKVLSVPGADSTWSPPYTTRNPSALSDFPPVSGFPFALFSHFPRLVLPHLA